MRVDRRPLCFQALAHGRCQIGSRLIPEVSGGSRELPEPPPGYKEEEEEEGEDEEEEEEEELEEAL